MSAGPSRLSPRLSPRLAPRLPRELLESILHAVAQTLQCNSANLAIVDEDEQVLLMDIGISARGVAALPAVESALGFSVSGLRVPLSVQKSLLVRSLREECLLCTNDVSEIAGGALPPEIVHAVVDIIGPRSFALAPVLGRTRALGVLLVDRVGEQGFTAQERGLLLIYAERLGAELESEALQSTAQRLERLSDVTLTLPPPLLLVATAKDEALGGVLYCVGGPHNGQPLHRILDLAGPEVLFGREERRRLLTGETLTLPVLSSTPSVVAGMSHPRPLRVSLRQSLDLSVSAAADAPLFFVAVEDIGWSQDLRHETALARERLTKVMRSIGDAILTLDRNGMIQQANEASHKLLGVSPAELCGTLGFDLAATPRSRAQLGSLGDRLRQSGFAELELRLLRKRSDGRPLRFLGHLSALLLCDETGAPAGAVWRIHDQTEHRRDAAERHKLRLRLLQSERLSALGEMAARIAHEVRNPLVSIGAAAQVIAEELPESSPVRGEALAIGSEVRRLDHILNNVLRFARPARAAAQRTDVVAVLRQVIDLLRPKAAGLTLRLDWPAEESGPLALIDGDQLKQVLWNVLLNACEAARPGDDRQAIIESSVRRRSSLHREGHTVLINIADFGSGIPVVLRRRVFDPFFSTKSRGTGLGLAICKQIVEEAGGRIRLLNRPGGGTRVVIALRGC